MVIVKGSTTMQNNNIPPIPDIKGDTNVLLDLFYHHSLQPPGLRHDTDYGDIDRLNELGGKVLELVITKHLFDRGGSMLTVSEIQNERHTFLNDDHIVLWTSQSGLARRLRFPPGQEQWINNPLEMRRLLNSYIGALYIRNGLHVVTDWVTGLIDPNAEPIRGGASIGSTSSNTSDLAPPYTPSAPPQPSSPPPPLPIPHSPTSPSSSGPSSSLVTLALFNQTAAQKRIKITYPAQMEGPPHQPMWTVQCCLDDIQRGSGTATSQKQAKLIAAQQAYHAMGW
ncbi:hypothetical protein BD779DRAFT_1600918 [Infundibulicybe gibba]|nr:hypothetical protein BD779DRAFT_1600918 [Infundibulicybe gibba]